MQFLFGSYIIIPKKKISHSQKGITLEPLGISTIHSHDLKGLKNRSRRAHVFRAPCEIPALALRMLWGPKELRSISLVGQKDMDPISGLEWGPFDMI